MKREEGFTLVELLATMALMAVLLTLGVGALRYFWLGQSLYDKRDEVYSNLRALQQQVVSESNPIVIGAWFKTGTPAGPEWGTVRLSGSSGTPTCTSTATFNLSGGIEVASASFADTLSGAVPSDLKAACQSASGVPASIGATDFVFFLARGTATDGCVTLQQTFREMTDVTVSVSQLTGRVERIEQADVEDECP